MVIKVRLLLVQSHLISIFFPHTLVCDSQKINWSLLGREKGMQNFMPSRLGSCSGVSSSRAAAFELSRPG